MADEKKSSKIEKTYPYVIKILIAISTVFFAWLEITERYIFMFNTVFDCYTFAFAAVFIFLVIYLINYMKKHNNNFDFNSIFIIILSFAVFICLFNSSSSDIKNSKVKDILPVNAGTAESGDVPSVVLCEVTKFNTVMNENSTCIDVFYVDGKIARKIGTIDEVYFSVECLKDNMYNYSFNYEKNTVSIECSYGHFGDGIVEINPAYETGKILYIFKLD